MLNKICIFFLRASEGENRAILDIRPRQHRHRLWLICSTTICRSFQFSSHISLSRSCSIRAASRHKLFCISRIRSRFSVADSSEVQARENPMEFSSRSQLRPPLFASIQAKSYLGEVDFLVHEDIVVLRVEDCHLSLDMLEYRSTTVKITGEGGKN